MLLSDVCDASRSSSRLKADLFAHLLLTEQHPASWNVFVISVTSVSVMTKLYAK